MEAIFSPQITQFQNYVWLYSLSGQIELLANAMRTGMQDLNTPLTAAYQMSLQNRLSLDLLLLHENGVCGHLDLNNKDYCVHVPNITTHLDEQLVKIKQVTKSSRDLRATMEMGWLNKIVPGFGLSFTGWLQSLLQHLIYVMVTVVIICVLLGCIKSITVKRVAGQYVMIMPQS